MNSDYPCLRHALQECSVGLPSLLKSELSPNPNPSPKVGASIPLAIQIHIPFKACLERKYLVAEKLSGSNYIYDKNTYIFLLLAFACKPNQHCTRRLFVCFEATTRYKSPNDLIKQQVYFYHSSAKLQPKDWHSYWLTSGPCSGVLYPTAAFFIVQSIGIRLSTEQLAGVGGILRSSQGDISKAVI
jgi:hypothetical protein